MASHQTLRVLLYAVAAIEGIVGVVLLLATGWVLSFTSTVFTLPYAPFVIALLKGIGIVVLALGYLLCVTARDPVRYVAVIDALVFILVAAAALNVYGVVALHLGAFYPASYLIVRAAFQLVLALALVALRPKEAPKTRTV